MRKPAMPHRDLMREQLAHRAARLMAEGGITDFAFAKRKAAKQLGALETQHLPSNQEVEAALHSYRTLLYPDQRKQHVDPPYHPSGKCTPQRQPPFRNACGHRYS